MAKLIDTAPRVRALLRFRSYDLYGWVPAGSATPEAPVEYGKLAWAPPLPPVAEVEATTRARMSRKPRDRTVLIARRVGWDFGDPKYGVAVAPAES